MLGLMQILHFVMDAQTLPLAQEIFKLSQHETQARPSALSASSRSAVHRSGKGKHEKLPFGVRAWLVLLLNPWQGEDSGPQKAEEPQSVAGAKLQVLALFWE